jgi:hypothetical protein
MAWFEKKGKHLACVCFESNLTEVPSYTLWIDSVILFMFLIRSMTFFSFASRYWLLSRFVFIHFMFILFLEFGFFVQTLS